jgi:RING-box protein 1
MESKFKIIKMNLITSSFYDLEKNTDCTICRCNLNENSLHSKDKGVESIIVTGVCGHSFHHECISPWIRNQPSCPICSSQWLAKK